MSIIKDMNTDIQRSELEEKASEGDTMAQAELNALDIGLVEESEDGEDLVQKYKTLDMKKLAKQLAKGAKDDDGKTDLHDEEMSEILGDDLEMLEYDPEEIEEMIPAIIKMVKELR